ncbi:MAG: hypothetical protein EPO30_09805 [Lysobacteraceae bacterium]|nr:MAG: hypothetical protein EPO30_09805 [Xanthomonadaceae bacterium]
MRCSWPNWSPPKRDARTGRCARLVQADRVGERDSGDHGLTSNRSIRQPRRRRVPALAWLLATVLVLVAGAAQALGLGQIQVKSRPGEPLLAEIPIISGDPSELQALQVRLASPETFRRVGLQPPDVAATGLQFTVAVDERGWPVVRVTSSAPLSQPLLTFLLEVDWGEGRLVREYTALVASPSTVAATPAQPLQAPVVSEPNTIGQVPEPAVVAEPLPEEPGAPAADATAAAAEPPADEPVEQAPDQAPGQAPEPGAIVAIPTPAPAAPPAPAPTPDGDYRVRAGDTLSEIASAMDRGGHSLDQTMLALLEANPAAFIGGNVNRLRAGAVLRMPQGGELARYSAGEAAALVRRQVAQWREATAALQQAPASGTIAADSTGATPAADGEAEAKAPAEARLQIVPPSSETGKAGTRTGIQAGGEGTMLQQQVQEAQETVAARDAEVGELKARVAELEQLQQQQQQLIAMKDSALAAAQKRLAESGTAATQAEPVEAADGGPAWPWLVLPLLVLVAAAAWWLLRRPGSRPRPRLFTGATAPVTPSSRVAPAPARAAPAPVPVPVPVPVPAPAAAPTPASAPEAAPEPGPAPSFVAEPVVEPVARPVPGRGPEPVSSLSLEPEVAPVLAEVAVAEPLAPHWTSAPALVGAPPVSPMTAAAALAAGREQATTPARQVELARAYLDLGDEGAARELLREVLDGRDPVARDIAARMLREL